ncbi:MAG: RDD family protein [Acidobacteriia bacterium]|nr:RDD family protein [Terriglobia bacterium]
MSLDPAWRAELAHRLAAYRARRRKLAPNDAQADLPFAHADAALPAGVAIAETPAPETPAEEAFAFTIAIGRSARPARDPREPARMEIDVSLPVAREIAPQPDETPAASPHAGSTPQLYPVAPLAERRIAAVLDAGCLLFAYGGFLTLFGSLGGVFTLSKLSAAVYSATIALFYLQYFALFTIFGGTTPGMMLRGLQVVNFSGETPSPRQLFLRSVGYVLSAGSFFLGFFWTFWDEDGLAWHDRISHTYLTAQEPLESAETAEAARSH